MSWLALSGDLNVRHVLDSARGYGRGKPWYALCGIELDGQGDGDNDLPACETCEGEWRAAHPRRTPAGHNRKLPRCICPTCGTEHINRA